ncbi:dermonecrotic toxin domain-containing protein [Pseudomonas sp. Irchel 3E19]|uniref:dermonecrotic toxin domain-containing protein n=1 Tax=Pseudomonas sp. Irchel 3E19 TaxID=2008981 RepID=UPI000BA3EBE3|nr:DUF6543 domain-containing protein [Pseudomonas sp. Irchel 3E19]
MTENTDATAPGSSLSLQQQSRLIDLTSQGPSLHQSASTLLRQALAKNYSHLNIDPDHAMIATPIRASEGAFHHYESLTHALVRLYYASTLASYLEGECFLTLMPHSHNPVHLAMDMDDVNSLINDHAPFLFATYQQLQLDYWNEPGTTQPRWQVLADAFKAAVNVQQATGWDADQCSLARLIAAAPDKQLRTSTQGDFKDVRACLLDVDLVEEASNRHLLIAGAIIMTATCKGRELILMYSINSGHETFASMQALGESLPARMEMSQEQQTLTWRLSEPEGNIFDAVAWALIGNQLDEITALDPANRADAPPDSAAQPRNSLGVEDRDRLDQLDQAIPAWLHDGSISDLQAYQHYIVKLSDLRDDAQKDTFREDDLPLIKTYAQTQMREAIIADKRAKNAADLPLDSLHISVTGSFESGGLVLPNPLDRTVETLGEFALQNSPPYLATLAFTDGTAVPAWLTVNLLTELAQQVNIGERYPRLIKRTLIDDPARAAQQKTRYTRQLPILLPLLALENKLRHQNGVNQRGYEYVCQLMEAIAHDKPAAQHPVTIRPLAFVPRNRLSKKADVVSNMFVIAPRDASQGPCLLYRPALDKPLVQFASLQNLLYALYQPGELRDSVLAWLPTESLGFEYAQYVFSSEIPSPWIVSQLAFEPLIHLDLAGPIDLANAPLSGDILAKLYDAHSQALIELADRQSVSNSERRWNLLADSGWTLFNVASNFFSGAAGTAVWVWQSISQIQQAVDANQRGEEFIQWKSMSDVLLVLGVLLSQHVAARRSHLKLPSFKELRETPLASENPDIPTRLPSDPPVKTGPVLNYDSQVVSGDIAPAHLSSLETGTPYRSATAKRFITLIDSFKMAAPAPGTHEISASSHLYTVDGKTCAQVGERWFQVIESEGEPLRIVDPANPDRKGPVLQYDASSQQWHWDLRIRLSGGAPTGRIAAFRRAREQKKDAAMAKLRPFLESESLLVDEFSKAVKVLKEAPDNLFDERSAVFLEQSQVLAKSYTDALEQLRIWNESGGSSVFYQSQLMRLTTEQHKCLSGWMRLNMRIYRQTLQRLLPGTTHVEPVSRQEQMNIANKAKTLSEGMVGALQTLKASVEVLQQYEGKPTRVARKLISLLPPFSRFDFLANEIALTSELCLRDLEEPQLTLPRQALRAVTASAADASHDLIALIKTPVSADGQAARIEQLIHFNDLYASADELVLGLPTIYPETFVQARLDQVRQQIAEFHELAQKRLVEELPDTSEIAAPPVNEPGPSRPQRKGKVTKTRPRQNPPERNPSTDESDSEAQIPFVKMSASLPVAPEALTNDTDIVAAALELNLKISEFNKSKSEDAKRPGRIPADIRDMFDQQVSRLNNAADETEQALARARATGAENLPVGSLAEELRAGAELTRTTGVTTYATMLKQRKPRTAYLQWLLANDQVAIVKDTRGRIRTKQRKDYFQEYQILDKTNHNKPLWVAHFHYDDQTVADEQCTVAHLKLADAYLLTLDAKTRQALDTFDAVDNVLRRLDKPADRDLFLKPQPRG